MIVTVIVVSSDRTHVGGRGCHPVDVIMHPTQSRHLVCRVFCSSREGQGESHLSLEIATHRKDSVATSAVIRLMLSNMPLEKCFQGIGYMAKKKSAGGLDAGARVRVKAGVSSPEFPEVSLGNWTGAVVEVSGKPPAQKFLVEWDDATLAAMPADYVSRCEAQQLFHAMAFLGADEIELVG